jgi:hypothetical protein
MTTSALPDRTGKGTLNGWLHRSAGADQIYTFRIIHIIHTYFAYEQTYAPFMVGIMN